MSPLRRANHAESCYINHPENRDECDCGLAKRFRLTQEEIAEGWHWCYEFDGLLVGPGMREMESCTCL